MHSCELITDHFVYIYIYCSDKKEYEVVCQQYESVNGILVHLLKEPYSAAKFWNSHLTTSNSDIMVYLNDDVILDEFCLRHVVEDMEMNYSDLDGVVGIVQSNIPEEATVKTAFGAIGRKFAERFPSKQVFFPLYERMYLDLELYLYATEINRFHLKKEATLVHLHPAYNKDWEDRTHFDVRKYLRHDRILFNQRRGKNYLWGRDFNQ